MFDAIEQRRGRAALGGALRGALPGRWRDVGHPHLDNETRLVSRPFFRQRAILRQRLAAALRPFLKRRLGVARRLRCRLNQLLELAPDERCGRRQPAVAIQRGDHRLQRIRENGRILAAAGRIFALGQAEMATKTDRPRHARQSIALNHRGVTLGDIAFAFTRKLLQQHFSDDQRQHSVAEEFEALKRAAGLRARTADRAGMRQRRRQQAGVRKGVTENGLEIGVGDPVAAQRADQRTRPKIRSKRIDVGHFQNSNQRAEPSVEKKMISARPTRFSAGTKPTSARLSRELSRLSPMAK